MRDAHHAGINRETSRAASKRWCSAVVVSNVSDILPLLSGGRRAALLQAVTAAFRIDPTPCVFHWFTAEWPTPSSRNFDITSKDFRSISRHHSPITREQLPFSFSYLKIENIRSLVRVLSTFKVHLFESFERRASMTPFLTRRCVFPRILFFFSFLYFLHRGLWIFRRNVFWYNDRFEPTFDVKGHLEWGLRYRRCDRVSGCCSG